MFWRGREQSTSAGCKTTIIKWIRFVFIIDWSTDYPHTYTSKFGYQSHLQPLTSLKYAGVCSFEVHIITYKSIVMFTMIYVKIVQR